MVQAAIEPIDRRGEIIRALYRCIGQQGYANSTLKEIAACAGMTPSHVRYYFDNKASILVEFASLICEVHLASLPEIRVSDRAGSVDALVEFCLGAGQTNAALLGVIQELNGLAVHDETLREIKSNHEVAFREYFERFFDAFPPSDEYSPREAAFVAHANLIGLTSNSVFDHLLDRERAFDLFRRTLRALVGFIPDRVAAVRAENSTRPDQHSLHNNQPFEKRKRQRGSS